MGWFMPRRSRSFAGSHGRGFPRRGGGPSRVPARAVLLLLVMVAALAPRAFAQTTPSPGARWTPGGVWTHDVTTTSLIGKLGLQQSVTITGGSRVWDNAAIDACPWTRVRPPLPSTSCDSLKSYGAIPGSPFRNRPLTVTNFAPTQAMIDNGGVVIRLRWQGYNSPAVGNVGMTEWVPLVPPPNATLVLMPASISENAGVSTVTATLDRTTSAATTITVSAAAVTPAVSGDFTLTGTTLTIAAGATTSTGTVTVTASDNNVDAPDKSVTVSGTATGEVANPSDVTLTIADDDIPALVLSAARLYVDEGDSASYTVRLATLPTAATVTVAVARSAGSATVTASPTSLTFTTGTWSTPLTVSVSAAEDNVIADTATLTHTASGGDYQGLSADLPVTVSDNDATPDVNSDGNVDTDDVLVMYYTYTALNLLEDAGVGERLRRLVFRPLRGSDSTLTDADAGYTAMLNAAKNWKLASAGDVNADGAVDTDDVLVMYYTYTALNLLEDPGVGERLRRLVFRPLRGSDSTLTDADAGYTAMLDAAKALASTSP